MRFGRLASGFDGLGVADNSKLALNQPAKRVGNFGVAGNRGGTSCDGIEIDVVAATGSLQDNSGSFQFANEFSPLQA